MGLIYKIESELLYILYHNFRVGQLFEGRKNRIALLFVKK